VVCLSVIVKPRKKRSSRTQGYRSSNIRRRRTRRTRTRTRGRILLCNYYYYYYCDKQNTQFRKYFLIKKRHSEKSKFYTRNIPCLNVKRGDGIYCALNSIKFDNEDQLYSMGPNRAGNLLSYLSSEIKPLCENQAIDTSNYTGKCNLVPLQATKANRRADVYLFLNLDTR
jgi:hypothetical protein